MAAIALVGMACRYPDARSPLELWENVLAQRRAFRRMPPERLRLEDYYSHDASDSDCTCTTEAALIEGYEFDRVRYRVTGSAFRSADLAHWLALDVAAEALADAGFPEGSGLPHDTTGVMLGNTLTGEFSRANVLRLRWPYMRRVVDAELRAEGWKPGQRKDFLARLENRYKSPFTPMGEETLAGALSNTIAGRICNYFDLHGGGYTVDGACASSLLAVINACSALAAGDLDVALAGGVDLSLDPFELVGFARAGALAREAMRVYDARATGFWPGEGCGILVLMRQVDAISQRRRVYAVIRGWGVSSDGSGGITRPEVAGQYLALRRAYCRAGFGIDTVMYFEGHGTGTAVGDIAELSALGRARQEAAPDTPSAVLGSVKANLGHTKAAAGAAGLIKTALALHTQILPPTTGCEQPNPLLAREAASLRVTSQGQCWPPEYPLRAGVSAMGFGGINTHVVLEGVATERNRQCHARERMLLSSAQDAELLLLAAADAAELRQQVESLGGFAARLAQSEVADLAAVLAQSIKKGPYRAAVVASNPAELASRLATLTTWLAERVSDRLDFHTGVFLGTVERAPRIGFLFPGQGSPVYRKGHIWSSRFEVVRDLYVQAHLPQDGKADATAVAQPAIVTASLAGLRVFHQFGIGADVGIGHSLGELTAFHWAGALDEDTVLRISRARGMAMEALNGCPGGMASIEAESHVVERLLNRTRVVLAGLNSPRQTIISGEASEVAEVTAQARAQGLRATVLPVSRAFHSPLVAGAIPDLAQQINSERFHPLQRCVFSTVTGGLLAPEEDLREILCRQVTSPVRFLEALSKSNSDIALWIEIGPGQVLSGLAGELIERPVVALDSGGSSLKGLWHAVGAAFVLGAPVVPSALFAGRFTRPFDLDWRPRFFVNPCELAPPTDVVALPAPCVARTKVASTQINGTANGTPGADLRALVRQLVSERAELPVEAVRDDDRLLGDLHLNSITVGQIVIEAIRRMGLPPPASPTEYADATVAEVARALEELSKTGAAIPAAAEERFPPGVDSWLRCFAVQMVERPLPRRQPLTGVGTWRVFATANHPLAAALKERLARSGGDGVVVCLPGDADERHVSLLLEGAQAVLQRRSPSRFVLVQQGRGGAALARTLHLEAPQVDTCVVDLPLDHPHAADWVFAEIEASAGYTEAHYDPAGTRREPVLRLLPDQLQETETPLRHDDVLLVTGGGKGIAAECAGVLAQSSGARLILIGRSRPGADAELSANLARLTAAGVRFRYEAADVTDCEALCKAVRTAEAEIGPVTAILHGAGANIPRLLRSLDEAAVLRTLRPKVQGFRNLLKAVNPDRLRLVVAFGSIIARTGLRGEADYALANDWLADLTERFQAEHPACRCLTVEWSVWSGMGMGERLGRVDALMRQGIEPIPPDVGVAWLRHLLSRQLSNVAVVVTGRFGEPPTLRIEKPELPFLRFLEQPRVYYPGVELITDAELSSDTDPYLNEHCFQGERLLPAVLGIEAMVQAAVALAGKPGPPVLEQVTFRRPIVVPPEGATTIRVAALVREPGLVEVVVRSAESAFQVDHFQAICRFAGDETTRAASHLASDAQGEEALLPLDPVGDLYGGLLFQEGRFRRLRGYRRLNATECIAEVAPTEEAPWFGRYLPPTIVLGDPGARDAAIHAIQACIPHARVLPISIERLAPATSTLSGPLLVEAWERLHEGDEFIYDLQIRGADGRVHECWKGLRLRRLGHAPPRGAWPVSLLGPYVERRLGELIPGSTVRVALAQQTVKESGRDSTRLLRRLLGDSKPIFRRPDGKVEVVADGAVAVSAAHAGDLTLAVSGAEPLGCDLERVTARSPSIWRDLIGPNRAELAHLIAQEMGEEESVSATRVWAAAECLKKAGIMVGTPLVLTSSSADGWAVLAAGAWPIVTLVTSVHGVPEPLVLAVLARSNHARL